jgi:hypothetical protein
MVPAGISASDGTDTAMLTYPNIILARLLRHRRRSAVPDEGNVRIMAHRRNIRRYRILLTTNLTAVERQFIDRCIEEEQAEISRLRQPSGRRPRAGTGGADPGSNALQARNGGRTISSSTTGC